jgi:uncharacterized protein with HEPN domain
LRSDRTDTALLAEINESTSLVASYIAGLSEATFESDSLRRDATAFRLLMIGEAASQMSSELKQRLPDLDWRGMIGLRNRLAHDYGSANFSVLWVIAAFEVPKLATALKDL